MPISGYFLPSETSSLLGQNPHRVPPSLHRVALFKRGQAVELLQPLKSLLRKMGIPIFSILDWYFMNFMKYSWG